MSKPSILPFSIFHLLPFHWELIFNLDLQNAFKLICPYSFIFDDFSMHKCGLEVLNQSNYLCLVFICALEWGKINSPSPTIRSV